jgi:hypothetical protein
MDVKGFAGWVECPIPVIVVQEGEVVVPGTIVHLFGDQSFVPCGGEIAKYEWSVHQPKGSVSLLIPSATFPNPTFEVNVAGTYTFKLTPYDGNGTPSCLPAEQTVEVIPFSAVHVELTWQTHGDPDESDEGPEAGSDLDLHLLHPNATGPDLDNDGKQDGWLNVPWDCYWCNKKPDWGAAMTREDTDGAGPEIILLQQAENLTYRVGVHYWDDHGFGPSFATVRVYVYGVLAFEWADVELHNHDMWEVATIEWPSGAVTQVLDKDGGPKITQSYTNCFMACP